jgi:Apea-like HEPN
MKVGAIEALLLEAYGERLLAYLCGADRHSVSRRLDEGVELSPQAEHVITRFLLPLAESVARQRADNPGLPPAFFLDALTQFDVANETSIANAIRVAAGGTLPSALTGTEADADPVKSALFRMARDAYAQLLATGDELWFMPRVSLYQHPVRRALDAAVAEDAALAALFPEDEPGLGRRGFVFNSLGTGATMQSVMFSETVIASAWDVANMTTDEPSLEDLLRAIDSNVDTIREAVAGGSPLVPARLVFTGITTDPGTEVIMPWGTLRLMSDVERRAAPASLEGAVSGTDQDGKSVTVSYAGEVVLDAHVPYQLVIRPCADLERNEHGWPPMPGAAHILRQVDALRLAVLLSVDRPPGSWVTARLAWQWHADPLSPGRSIGWSDVRSAPGFMPYHLSAEDCQQVAAWGSRIDAHWKPQIDIAVRRVLSAAHARTDPADRLVDSVIAWENLFGTSEGEPRLRVSAAMAWLLEPDAGSRLARQDQLKRLYDDRSKIVHGAPFDERRLGERANEALAVARSTLGLLFRDRPDLLGLRDGAERSLRLLLGAQ